MVYFCKIFCKKVSSMFSFLSPDSKFTAFLGRFADMVLLNILFLITCLPVFTAGAASAALYTVCFRIFRNRENGIVKAYFRAFGDNFRQGTALWLLLLFVCVPGILYFDAFFHMDGLLRYLFAVCLLIVVLSVFVAAYGFPWISQFRNRTGEVLRNCLILSLTNLPQTLCLCAIHLLPLILLAVKPDFFLKISFLLVALYFSAAAYVSTALLWKVFKPYYPEET